MNTANAVLTIGGINADVVYKDIKNMHISVYPPLGRVHVAAPLHVDEDSIRIAIIQRLTWIKKQQFQFRNAQRQTQREMVTGESHYLWGQRFRLELGAPALRSRIELAGRKLILSGPPSMDDSQRRKVLENWYRRQLRAAIPPLIEKWETIIGFSVEKWAVRRMKTKWGTCNPESRSLWFNTELAKKEPLCLEYIVVHEMTHFLERTHNDQFIALMDSHLPNWRSTRDLLNGAPLVDESWT